MIIGAIANFCGYEAAMSCIKGVAVKSGSKIINKLAIPVGAFLIASMVGDKCQFYAESKVNEVKTAINDVKRQVEEQNAVNEPETVSNIFDTVESTEEEVTEDGDSENA